MEPKEMSRLAGYSQRCTQRNKSSAHSKSFVQSYDKPTLSESFSMRRLSTVSSGELFSPYSSMEDSPKTSLADVKKRVVAAAFSGLSKSARSSPMEKKINVRELKYIPKSGARPVWQMEAGNLNTFAAMNASALPDFAQEQAIIFDLLCCLMGNNGNFIIKSVSSSPNESHLHSLSFTISDEISVPLRQLAAQLLPMASQYAMIDEFICLQESVGVRLRDHTNSSRTHQALASALQDFVNEYISTIVQLEADAHKLSLVKVHYLLHDTQHLMSSVAESVVFIHSNNLNAAELLTYLAGKITILTGDDNAQQIHIILAQKAYKPYFEILDLWILKGVIKDPMNEFMLEDQFAGNNNTRSDTVSYWDFRYKLRKDCIPSVLEDVSDKILKTGKYLNVIRQCGFQAKCQMECPLIFVPNNKSHLTYVHNAYNYASQHLYELLMKDNDLVGHLTNCKRYMLLSQGDFVNHFMDAIAEELSQVIAESQPNKLSALLEMSLRISSAKDNPYIDQLAPCIFEQDLVTRVEEINTIMTHPYKVQPYNESLKIYECMGLVYNVEWPISLVINPLAMLKYQLIFGFQFYFHYVNRLLNRVWLHTKDLTKFEQKMTPVQGAIFSLYQRMLHTIQNIQYYISMEVIEPIWQRLLSDLKTEMNVDHVLFVHNTHLDSIVNECMLQTPTLMKTLIAICTTCIDFSEMVLRSNIMMLPKDFENKVDSCSNIFSQHVEDLLDKIVKRSLGSTSDRTMGLVDRLNFNLYFSKRMDWL